MFKSLNQSILTYYIYFFLKPTHNDRAVNKDAENNRKLKRTKKQSLVTVSSRSSCINHCLTLSCSTFKKKGVSRQSRKKSIRMHIKVWLYNSTTKVTKDEPNANEHIDPILGVRVLQQ